MMQERIIEIIVYLLEELQQAHSWGINKDLSEHLMAGGYTDNEINLAYAWIFNHLQNKTAIADDQFPYKSTSRRLLLDIEKLLISAEAYGYLLQLHYLGLITDQELEIVIEKSLDSGSSSLSIDEIKSIVAAIMFRSEASNSWRGIFSQPGEKMIH